MHSLRELRLSLACMPEADKEGDAIDERDGLYSGRDVL